MTVRSKLETEIKLYERCCVGRIHQRWWSHIFWRSVWQRWRMGLLNRISKGPQYDLCFIQGSSRFKEAPVSSSRSHWARIACWSCAGIACPTLNAAACIWVMRSLVIMRE